MEYKTVRNCTQPCSNFFRQYARDHKTAKVRGRVRNCTRMNTQMYADEYATVRKKIGVLGKQMYARGRGFGVKET